MSAPPCLSLKKRRSVTADDLRRQCEEIIAAFPAHVKVSLRDLAGVVRSASHGAKVNGGLVECSEVALASWADHLDAYAVALAASVADQQTLREALKALVGWVRYGTGNPSDIAEQVDAVLVRVSAGPARSARCLGRPPASGQEQTQP